MTPSTRRTRTITAVATAAVAAALAGAPAASAATGIGFNPANNTVTLTGDDLASTIVIADDGTNLTHSIDGAPASTSFGGNTLPANDTVHLVVNAAGGVDDVSVQTARLLSVNVDAGAGTDTVTGSPDDDILRGGPDADQLRGADGDDRVIGDTGNDDMEGGNGNDTLVWNNGDNNDVMDGDAGNDGIEVNGDLVKGDQFTLKPNPADLTRVRFDRINLGLFNLDINAERIEVNGAAGDDQMTGEAGLAPLILPILNGGAGADRLTGGDGVDLINGGEDADTLAGGDGNDRVVGDRGGDTMAGGNGDDTLVWNNGDGSDRMDGESGLDRVEVNGDVRQGDAFTIAPNGGRAKFDRTNLVPFTLDIGSTEALDARGAAGDDTFSAAAGTGGLLAVTADGGAGNDTLTGADEADTFSGGSGNDVLTGGTGPDLLDGQDGDDRILARDGQGDLVRGGAGADSAQTDAIGIDIVDGIGALDATPAPAPVPGGAAADTKATAVRVNGNRSNVRIRRGRATTRLSLNCPAAEAGGCTGTVSLFSARRVRIGSQRVVVLLGTASYSLRAGETKRITMRLPKGIRRLGDRAVAARAATVTRDRPGNVAVGSKAISLRLPRR